jgi:hypothetical protein
MKLVKSLLLGSAAGIAAVAGAHAADLPSRKAAPVEYVRVCSAYGAGFFYIPGTDTCLRVGGRVRAEYAVGTRFGETADAYGTRARGRLNIDARTATAYGTLRTFIRYELSNNAGNYVGSVNFNPGINLPGQVRNTTPAVTDFLDLAFVQFGPVTAGRAQSFFDFYANDLSFTVLRTADARVNLLAYTATFGSGFSATISLEDRTSGLQVRENGVVSPTGLSRTLGQDFPDLIASLRVDQGWGSAQLSGALSQRNISNAGAAFNSSKDELAFAVQGGVKINLPMLAAGDVLFLQAAYADGALGYLGWFSQFGSGRQLTAAGAAQLTIADYSVDALGNTGSATGWSLVAALRHFWTPQLRSELFGSYSELKLGYTVAGQTVPGVVARPLDPKELIVGANLIWSPVPGLDVGVEVLYNRTELKQAVLAANNAGVRQPLAAGGRLIKSDDAIAGRLRIQRDF